MNRIAGIFNFDHKPVEHADVVRMLNALKSQRRSKEHIWTEGFIGLGHTHAWDPGERTNGSFDAYPLPAGLQITFDGRIDNREDLLAILRPEWLMTASRITNETIVCAAYEKWGTQCPRRLIGDFALAIWDPERQLLMCTRDHFGVKPLYYSLTPRAFLFASTPDALLASGKVPAALREERIADFLVNPLEGIDKSSTFYRYLYRLPPAHTLIVQGNGMTIESYWRVQPTAYAIPMNETRYVEEFLDLFSEAVQCRLQDGVRVASMLSGGIDSSAIVTMGRSINVTEKQDPLTAFAFISQDANINRETSYIISVVKQGGLDTCFISEEEFSQQLARFVMAIEDESEPFDWLMNLSRAIYIAADDQEIDAVMDGIDGDILLNGSGHMIPLWSQGNYRTILEETLLSDGLTDQYKMGKRVLYSSFFSAFMPFAPRWLQRVRRPIRHSKSLRNAVTETVIEPEFAARSRLGNRFEALHTHSPRSRSEREAHRNILMHPFLTVGLERYERVSSAFGIEARHPFTDVRLVEFCLGLPWQLKTRRGWTKMILRKAMEPYLPHEVVWRRDKDSLMWEVNRLILKERKDYFYQATQDEQTHLQPYVDMRKLNRFWDEYLTHGDETHSHLIWSGIALAFWLRRHRNMVASLKVPS
jgi:asparagine synthase (glutamine-hydrolysing)